MKKILLTLCSALIATASFAQIEKTIDLNLKRPQCLHDKPSTRAIADTKSPTFLPHKGSPRVLTILVNFKDTTFSVKQTRKAFNEFFNSKTKPQDLGNGNSNNYKSVASYFSDMSNGAFTPVFDVYGPVKVSHPCSYYGGTDPKDETGSDEHVDLLVNDAMALLKDSINDVSIYDSNNDGYIDCVYIIYAGYSQNGGGGDGTNIWAKTGRNPGSTYTDKKGNTLNAGFYSMAGELRKTWTKNGNKKITGIGVTCHELSHALGLPDTYPTVSSARVDNQEMEYWDLMDAGEYTYEGCYPTPYTAWEKYQMEWGNENIVTLSKSGKYTMSESTSKGGKTYKIENPANKQEYFLLENIKGEEDSWEAGAYATGLLVYHVVDDGNIDMWTRYNNIANKPRMAVVPADAKCLSSYIDANAKYYETSLTHDLFPDAGSAKSLNDDLKLPNFYWYTSSNAKALYNSNYYKTNVALKNIAVDSKGKITFDYVADTTVTAINELNSDEENALSSAIYSLDGRYVGTDSSALPAGIYIKNHKKFAVQ